MEILFKNSETLTGEEISLWETEFDSKRVALVNRKQEKDRILSICGDLLILKAFKSKFKDKPLLTKYTEHGKPYLKDNEFYISVSHKGNLAVCAVCEREIGIDIESVKTFDKRLADRICNEQELNYIGNDDLRFAQIWTIKEAYSKLCGHGIAMGLKSIIIDIQNKTVCNLPYYTEVQDGYVYSWVVSEKFEKL